MEGSEDTTVDTSIMWETTNPSQLEEVTLDPEVTFTNSIGVVRSPNGPMRGRSVKEFEEQLDNLKKENFNLKVRIYHLEQRMGLNFNLSKENIVKKNVELMVEVESLRKELKEKHELLCQAVKAMELEEEEHKKVTIEKDAVIAECQQETECLRIQLVDLKQENDALSHKPYQSCVADLLTSQASHGDGAMQDLQDKISVLEEELKQEKTNNAAIQLILDQKDAKIAAACAELSEATYKMANYETRWKQSQSHLEELTMRTQSLAKELDDQKKLSAQYAFENAEIRTKYSIAKSDLEREHERYKKLKVSSEQHIVELQTKLEGSLHELKKSQDLVVAKNEEGRSRNTDDDSFSVPKPATSPRSPKTNSVAVSAVLSPYPVSPYPTSPSPLDLALENSLEGDNVVEIVKQLKAEREAHKAKIVKLRAEQIKACKIIKSMIESRNKANQEIDELKRKNEELEQELEVVVSKPDGEKLKKPVVDGNSVENSMDGQSEELIEHYKALTNELEEKNLVLLATMAEKESQMKQIQEQYEAILDALKRKEDHVVDLEFEVLSLKQEKVSEDDYAKHLEEKEAEIEQLNRELLKRNCDLQGLVNNELWDKNREIEKLQKKQFSQMIETKDDEISKLETEVAVKDAQLRVIKEKIAEMGIEIDLESGDGSKNPLQAQLEKSEKSRIEAHELCGVLSRRLEELAIFLDSLLRQKLVLGFLANKDNQKLRRIIDQSLDLSRSFTMSMIVNPEKSLMQLSNISGLLNDTTDDQRENATSLSLAPENATLTYESHLHGKNDEESQENSQIIDTLRQQIVNLKYELQLRDVELNKLNVAAQVSENSEKSDCAEKPVGLNTTSTTLKYQTDNQSESEAWSEPDRTVSRARMGLLDESIKSNSPKKPNFSSGSEDIDRSSRGVKKSGLNESRHTIIELHKQLCEADRKLNDKHIAYEETAKLLTESQSNNVKLMQQLENLEIKLLDTEAKLMAAEARKSEADGRLVEVQKLVEDLQKAKEDLAESMTLKNKDLLNRINELEVEKKEALMVAEEAGEVAKIAKDELKYAQTKLRDMQKEMENLQESLEDYYTTKMATIQTEFGQQLQEVRNQAEAEVESLQETIKQMRVDYVQKREVEVAIKEVEQLTISLEKASLAERTTKEQLVQYQEKFNVLRNDLDNATLQYSEAVLEKTKLINEKACLEQELTKASMKQQDLVQQISDLQNEFGELKQEHHKQLSSLQQQKTRLEVKVSELESSNAELHNRLIKIQAGYGDQFYSVSLPNPSNFSSYRRQVSDNSEDFSCSGRVPHNALVDVERHEANSSPDLGIESDHGRFSSLETHLNTPRPLLQTLELTESMSNLLDGENSSVNCDSDHCCEKTMQMAHENTDLRRKLLKTRRALEETVFKLTLANQRKKQVEKTICKQIHKTSQVLKKAKANLDSGSETDLYKK